MLNMAHMCRGDTEKRDAKKRASGSQQKGRESEILAGIPPEKIRLSPDALLRGRTIGCVHACSHCVCVCVCVCVYIYIYR